MRRIIDTVKQWFDGKELAWAVYLQMQVAGVLWFEVNSHPVLSLVLLMPMCIVYVALAVWIHYAIRIHGFTVGRFFSGSGLGLVAMFAGFKLYLSVLNIPTGNTLQDMLGTLANLAVYGSCTVYGAKLFFVCWQAAWAATYTNCDTPAQD